MSINFPIAPVGHGAQQIALGNSALALMGPWKFRLGDDLAWGQPGFDDAAWQNYTLDAQGWPESILPERNEFDPGWGGHGYRGAPNYGWYRIHVSLHRASSSLRLLVPRVDSAYTVYWDGHELGGDGDPSRRWFYYIHRTQEISIPSSLGGIGDHVLAVRVRDLPLGFADPNRGGLRGAPLLADGTTAPRIKQLALRLRQLNLAVTALTEVLPCLLVALISLLLYFYNRKHLEYLWTGLTLVVFTFADVLVVLDSFSATGWLTQTMYSIVNVLGASAFLFSLLALQWLLGLEDRRRMLVANLIAGVLTFLLWIAFAANGEWLGSVKGAAFLFDATEASILPCLACLLWMAGAGIRKLGREAWLMLSPGAVISLLFLWVFFAYGRLPLPVLAVGDDILTILVPASVLAILIYRFVRQWREHQRMEGELQQAQAVQALLVPERLPQTDDYRVEGTYLPASQVGGDFYQVLPLAEGGLMVVLGDVSGKGLRAAMVVSMAVGAVRAIAKETSEPAEILTRLNRELAGNLKSGFVTCLCARFDADGRVTVANAGHLPPWVNGKEFAMPGALPLGMLAAQGYESQSFQMNDGDGIMVMSDGVVEARSEKDGQLYGFERISEILQQPITAAEVAAAAQNFGQEDDISVLSVTRTTNPKAVPA
ncbi:MAG: PP2C family protein-serine/threonine phosphatase [Acidobacteriaceae bacterium]